MGITALFQRLCLVEIRRLLLIIGTTVAFIVVFQCLTLPYGKRSSLSPDGGLMVMMSGNATILDNSNSTIYVFNAVANDSYAADSVGEAGYENQTKETNVDCDLASDVHRYLDGSFHKYEYEKSSCNGLTFKKGVTNGKSLIIEYVTSTDNNSAQVEAIEVRHGHLEQVGKIVNDSKVNDGLKATTGSALEGDQNRAGYMPVLSPGISTKDLENLDADSRISDSFLVANMSSAGNAEPTMEPWPRQTFSDVLNNNSTVASISMLKRWNAQPTSISQMNSLLLQTLVSTRSARPHWSSVRDRELLSAKLEIENASNLRNTPGLYASVFRNISMFKRSYELMERVLKVYIYKEGEKPIFHQPQMRGIYASEGWFMKLMEGNKKFVVRDPRKAHLFYLPLSIKMLRIALFGQNFQSHKDLEKYLKNYLELIAGKYSFWNRTGGADHFLVACHDWAPRLTMQHMRNCIRSLCNANVAKGFTVGMDTTLPVTYIRSMEAPLKDLGGKPSSERAILAFFAGSMHGYLRPILLQYWENKEHDMKIFGPMPRDVEGKRRYRELMKSSKYCICARGYEVHTPRVVEAIFYECVPVIISDNYVPPFFEVFNWEAFSVFVQEKDIPNLRNILLSIPEEKFLAMQLRVKMVQKHFLWHKKPMKYDLFHMILHSVWYNRVFQIKTR